MLLALTAAWLGYVAFHHALAYNIRVDATDRAHALAPGNGRITALLAEKILQEDTSAAGCNRAETLARLALREDPTAVDAVATLGLSAQMRNNASAARRLFHYSDMLSRRDLRTRLWLIEDSVARGDVPGALRNYDIALRTARTAPNLLFPVLSSAISDVSIRHNLVQTLAAKPAWGNYFLSQLAENAPDMSATSKLFQDLTKYHVALSNDASAVLINRMISHQQYIQAWSYYASMMTGVDAKASRDPRFTANIPVPTAFDWQAIQGNGISTSIQKNGDYGVLDFIVAPSIAGALLRQVQVLPPGDYLLDGQSAGIDQPNESLPYWVLACVDGRELGRATVSNSAQNNGRFIARFIVPADCTAQVLTLVARPSDQIAGVSGQIGQVSLHPVSSGRPKR